MNETTCERERIGQCVRENETMHLRENETGHVRESETVCVGESVCVCVGACVCRREFACVRMGVHSLACVCVCALVCVFVVAPHLHHLIWLAMFSGILFKGTWPGPSFMICTSFSQALRVSSPCTASSENWAKSLASAMQPGLGE